MPLARDVVKDLAVEHGGRASAQVQLRRSYLTTGETEPVLVPCGNTIASGLPAVRRTGLKLCAPGNAGRVGISSTSRSSSPMTLTDEQKWWIEKRADAQVVYDGGDSPRRWMRTSWMNCSPNWTTRSATRGMRGNVLPCPAATAAPVHQATEGCRATAQAHHRPSHGRQDLHRAILARPSGPPCSSL